MGTTPRELLEPMRLAQAAVDRLRRLDSKQAAPLVSALQETKDAAFTNMDATAGTLAAIRDRANDLAQLIRAGDGPHLTEI